MGRLLPIIDLGNLQMEIGTEAELLDALVEHIDKSSVGRADLAHWPNCERDIDLESLDHVIPGWLSQQQSKTWDHARSIAAAL